MIGVTSDEILQKKTLAKYNTSIEPASQRVREVLDFVSNLAPGIKNRIQIKIIHDAFGPPATEDHFTALVLSHETLDNGLALNEIRRKNVFMSSTFECFLLLCNDLIHCISFESLIHLFVSFSKTCVRRVVFSSGML